MNTNNPIVIVASARTPLGAFQGELSSLRAPQLGGAMIQALIQRSGLSPEVVNQHLHQVLMGCVLTAGVGQSPARQAAINGALPLSTGCTTINKVCGSALQAIILAHDLLLAGTADMVIAGGMESMSQAPYLLPKARTGWRMGHKQVLDHMFFDGLEDAYSAENRGRLMGSFAEDTAKAFGFTRAQQDAFATESAVRAQRAIRDGAFTDEITPINIKDTLITTDETARTINLSKIPQLKPAFAQNGTVTAANASSIADGAAGVLLMRHSQALQCGLTPIARIVAHSHFAGAPHHFPTAPIQAINRLLDRTQWRVDDVDAFEVNEAFAVVTMAAMQALRLPSERVNVHGGACALGHPIGATGARLVVTLLGVLQTMNGKRGVASLCIGGGEAMALAIEMM